MIRLAIFDFDGIFAKYTFSSATKKEFKTYQLAARHCIEMLVDNGVDVVFMSGDKDGFDITKSILKKFPVSVLNVSNTEKVKAIIEFGSSYSFSEIAFIGDDLPDLGIAMLPISYMTHCNALNELKRVASYVSEQTPDFYLVADICMEILSHNGVNASLQVRTAAFEHIVAAQSDKLSFNIVDGSKNELFSTSHITNGSTYEIYVYDDFIAFKNAIATIGDIVATSSPRYIRQASRTMLYCNSLFAKSTKCSISTETYNKILGC